MLTAIAAIIIFSILVFVHELGHYTAAKTFGVKVHEFAIGMGPAIFKKQKDETLYSVRCLPIGGYVKLEGEDESSEDERSLNNQPKWKRAIIMAAGSIMNLALGLLISILMLIPVQEFPMPIINELAPGMPAQTAGMQTGDQIKKIGNTSINTYMDLKFELYRSKGNPTDFTIQRGNEQIVVNMVPVITDEKKPNDYKIGFAPEYVVNSPLMTIQQGYYQALFGAKSVIVALSDLIKGIGTENLSGPVGIVGEIGGAVDKTKTDAFEGFMSLLSLFMLISINLGMVNLLPLPALDGGRILFLLVEFVIRKPIPAEKEGMVHAIGFMLLIGLMLFATYNDILRLIFK